MSPEFWCKHCFQCGCLPHIPQGALVLGPFLGGVAGVTVTRPCNACRAGAPLWGCHHPAGGRIFCPVVEISSSFKLSCEMDRTGELPLGKK